MAERGTEFAVLMDRVREGSDQAAWELVQTYGSHILRVVRRKLHAKLRPKFDSQDFVQAVWVSFFALPRQKYTFDKPEALIAFLGELARNKVVEAVRQRLCSQKYNVNRERPLLDGPWANEAAVATRQPTPSEIAIAREEWERLMRDQPAHYQQILVLLRSGQNKQQVAREMGLNEKTVRRVLRKLSPKASPDRHEIR